MGNKLIKEVIKRLLRGEDYRAFIVKAIDGEFLREAISFFKDVVNAKLEGKELDIEDWYKATFLDPRLKKIDIANNAGLNLKTIGNMHQSQKKEIVLNTAGEHYDKLLEFIESLLEEEKDFAFTLTITFRGVSAELSLQESLLVINALAVKRASMRGGSWSQVGKRIEYPLMQTLCALSEVPESNFVKGSFDSKNKREVDFYLKDKDGKSYTCEIKLMGKGNPESADAPVARKVDVFIADELSDTNKEMLDSAGIRWLQLRGNANFFLSWENLLSELEIPFKAKGKIDGLEKVLNEVLGA
ncbi:MAG: CfrBI family restriction endonuclease [Cytophagales bacterium]|nr:CfrBI family restriction endonuclease [Cytophagales bacterium]